VSAYLHQRWVHLAPWTLVASTKEVIQDSNTDFCSGSASLVSASFTLLSELTRDEKEMNSLHVVSDPRFRRIADDMPSIRPSRKCSKCPHNENNNAGKMTMLNGIPNRRGRRIDPLLRLRCYIIPNLNTGVYNSITIKQSTIIYIHNTDGGGVIKI